MAKGKLDFDVPSNNPMVNEDKTGTLAWLQLFTRWQWIIGARKSWQNMLPQRALAVPFVNGTGREITVLVAASSTSAAAIVFTLLSGVSLRGQMQASAGSTMRASYQIPNGETYTVTVSAGTGTLLEWIEYR